MDITLNVSAPDKTQAVVNSASDRTPVDDFELLVVGNRISVTLRFCDDDGATPAFVTDATTVIDCGVGIPTVDGTLDYATISSMAVSGSTRTGTLDLNTAALINAVNLAIGCRDSQQPQLAPFTFEVRKTTAAGVVESLCLQRAQVASRVLPLVLDANPNQGPIAVLYDPATGNMTRPATALNVPSGATLTIESGASIVAASGSTVTGFGTGGGSFGYVTPAPSSPTATASHPSFAFDSAYIYFTTAANTWLRALGSTWSTGTFTYLRPDGVSRYLRPDGTSIYIRP
jgi:hypothetical protein